MDNQTESQHITKLQKKLPDSTGLLIKDCKESKLQLVSFVTQCFQSLKTYGKGAESLEASINMHLMCLEDYPFEKVKTAFVHHVKTSNEAPTPADIIKIIEAMPLTIDEIMKNRLKTLSFGEHLLTPQQKIELNDWLDKNPQISEK